MVTSSNWLYQISIVQENLYLQWHHDWGIIHSLLRSKNFPTKILHGIFERICIRIKDKPGWILSYLIISIYHRLLLCLLILDFYLQSVTVTYSLIRVPILWRVSINIISHFSLKFFIIAEYKPGALVGPKGMKRNIYFWLSGGKKAKVSLSTWQTEIWGYPCLSSRLIIQILFDPAPMVFIESSQRGIRK